MNRRRCGESERAVAAGSRIRGAIADHGSFVRAAEHWRVAQPSLSAQVRKLEAWLGIAVFERTTRRVIITAEGNAFVEQARRVLAEARHLLTIVQHSHQPFGGVLRVAAISTLVPYTFPRILPALRKNYPGLRLVLSEGLTNELVPKLVDGEVDAVLLSLPHSDPSVDVDVVRYWRARRVRQKRSFGFVIHWILLKWKRLQRDCHFRSYGRMTRALFD